MKKGFLALLESAEDEFKCQVSIMLKHKEQGSAMTYDLKQFRHSMKKDDLLSVFKVAGVNISPPAGVNLFEDKPSYKMGMEDKE